MKSQLGNRSTGNLGVASITDCSLSAREFLHSDIREAARIKRLIQI